MDGAMPVDARKKPKSTATMAGPALIDPPRINTTRMIANSSTTDSEMATTDHTLGRSALPARGCQPRAPPPEPSCHQRGPRMRQVRHRRSHLCRTFASAMRARPARGPQRPSAAQQFDGAPAQGIQRDRFHVHTTRSQVIRIVVTGTAEPSTPAPQKANEADIPPESPPGHMPRLVRRSRDNQDM